LGRLIRRFNILESTNFIRGHGSSKGSHSRNIEENCSISFYFGLKLIDMMQKMRKQNPHILNQKQVKLFIEKAELPCSVSSLGFSLNLVINPNNFPMTSNDSVILSEMKH
jgi:hypothetical protein